MGLSALGPPPVGNIVVLFASRLFNGTGGYSRKPEKSQNFELLERRPTDFL